jgi:hypothetical protein
MKKALFGTKTIRKQRWRAQSYQILLTAFQWGKGGGWDLIALNLIPILKINIMLLLYLLIQINNMNDIT